MAQTMSDSLPDRACARGRRLAAHDFTPEDSVCDSNDRGWSTLNVFVADASAMPMQGAANRALTNMAASSGLAERLIGGRAEGTTPVEGAYAR